MIDAELARARERVQAGTPRAGVYEATIANGATSPVMLPMPEGGGEEAAAAPDADRVYDIAVPRNAPTRGAANAPVTIQIFSDFQCPFCSRVGPTIEQVMEQYEGRVRFVYKHHPLPVHASARPAAIALQAAAAQGRFWDMLDVTYQAPVSPETGLYDAQARSLGLDLQRYRRDVEAPGTAAAVDADAALAKQLGVKGVPAWFINGKEIVGHRPLDVMKEAIDAELKK